jgi:hypothetical protein
MLLTILRRRLCWGVSADLRFELLEFISSLIFGVFDPPLILEEGLGPWAGDFLEALIAG